MKLTVEVDTDDLADADVYPGLAELGFTTAKIDDYITQNGGPDRFKEVLTSACLDVLAETIG